MTAGDHRRKVAVFDFDGTVSRRDTLVPFVAGVAGLPRSAAASLAVGWSSVVRREFHWRDRDELKAHLVRRLLAGRSERDLQHEGALYATRIIDRGLRPEMVDQVRRHVAAGHETLFVSASLVYYLEPIARYLQMTDVIAVELESRDGTLSGEMVHPNVRAAEKEVRLRRWLRGNGRDARGCADSGDAASSAPDVMEMWAYGNSSGDHALMDMADHAFWLGKPDALPAGATQFSAGASF